MKKILVSACLLGDKVRYDGKGQFTPSVYDLKSHFELVLLCPEMEAGLKTPRARIEIRNGKAINENDVDLSIELETASKNILRLCKHLGISAALLKSKSPSCGNKEIYDGTFHSRLVPGSGVLAALLMKNGISVFNETEIDQLLIDQGIIKVPVEE